MSLPKDGGLDTSPPAVAALTPSGDPCPAGPDVPREGSRDIQNRGKVIAVPHDWCKSTDSPVPYKIWCWQSDAGNLANSVRQTDCRSHVLGSYVRECYGDEPGKGGGVKSGTCQAECTPMTWSSSVRAEGRPMVRRFDKWHMNHGNTWGCLENPEDTGTYDAPKAKLIKPQLSSPIPSREDDAAAAAHGTKVAGGVALPASGTGTSVLGTIGRIGAALPEAGPVLATGAAAGVSGVSGVAFGTGYNAHISNTLNGMNLTAPGLATPPTSALNLAAPPVPVDGLRVSMAKFPPGYMAGDKGGEEWGRRKGIGKDAGRRRFHEIKQDDNMSKAGDDYGVNPETGDVVDPHGEHVGNLGD